MRDVSGTRPTPPVDASGDAIVTDDLVCIGCGYNLRTLRHAGRCPECARRVWDSVTGADLRDAPPEYVALLARNAHHLRLCCEIGAVLTLLVAIVVAATIIDEDSLFALAPPVVLGLVVAVVAHVAVWRLATPDPRGTRRVAEITLTRVLRVMLIAGPTLLPIAVVFACADISYVAVTAAVLSPVCFLALPALVAARIRSLGLRAAHREVANRAREAARGSYILVGVMFLVTILMRTTNSLLVTFFVAVVVVLPVLLTWRRAFGALASALEAPAAPRDTEATSPPCEGAS